MSAVPERKELEVFRLGDVDGPRFVKVDGRWFLDIHDSFDSIIDEYPFNKDEDVLLAIGRDQCREFVQRCVTDEFMKVNDLDTRKNDCSSQGTDVLLESDAESPLSVLDRLFQKPKPKSPHDVSSQEP